jgi:hypothetical protein
MGNRQKHPQDEGDNRFLLGSVGVDHWECSKGARSPAIKLGTVTYRVSAFQAGVRFLTYDTLKTLLADKEVGSASCVQTWTWTDSSSIRGKSVLPGV